MALQSIEARPSAVEACAASLREAILRGEFALGARLPPERQLADTLGVNRVTARGALSRLVNEGLLSVRQGSGYQVQDFLASGGPELLSTLAAQRDRKGAAELVKDLLEVRRALAAVVLQRLASRKPKKAELAAVAQAIDALEAAASASPRQVAEADLAVLGAVVAATASDAFRLALNPIGQVLLSLPGLKVAMFRAPLENVAAWRALLAWLGEPSPEGVALILAALAERDEATVQHLRKAPK